MPDALSLVAAARAAAETGGRVLVVYSNVHDPPDRDHSGARRLAETLDQLRHERFGPLHVYEFARR